MLREKSNLTEELRQKDEELMGSPSLFGPSCLTQCNKVNAMRGLMFCTHTKQFLCLTNPEPPLYATGAENVVGKYSSGYKKVKHDSEVFRHIKKFGDMEDTPYYYGTVFLKDLENKKIKIAYRKEMANLTELYGYHYNNDVIDSLEEGDKVKKDTILYRSDSYDEDMNYRYGKNAYVLYSLDAQTTEDAAIIRKGFADQFESYEVKTFKIPLNDNQTFINYYGDNENYQPLPKVGQPIKNRILAAKRTRVNNQILNDFKNSSLSQINYETDEVYSADGVVTDIRIFNNSEELTRTSFNSELLDYLDSETHYWEEIKEACEAAYALRDNDGWEITNEVNHLYHKANQYLNTEYKWKEGDGVFNCMVIEIEVTRKVKTHVGQKITMRYGNKAVASVIRPDYLMPHRDDGTPIDIEYSVLGIINRTTSGPLIEESVTFACERIQQYCKTLKTYKERADVIFDVIGTLNEDEAAQYKALYSKWSKKEREEFIDSCVNDHIYIFEKPMTPGKPMFFKLLDLYEKYKDVLKPYDIYVYKFGRWIKAMNPVYVGQQYVMKLKQTAPKGFSARSTGEVSIENLPDKSRSHKDGTTETSENTVRFGEFETYELKIGMSSADLNEFITHYRSSIKGRRDLVRCALSDEETFKFDKSYTSRVNEIMAVFLKSLGVEIRFLDDMETIEEYNDDEIKEHRLKDKTYLCTDWEFFKIELRQTIEDKILGDAMIMNEDELKVQVDKLYNEAMAKISIESLTQET